MNESPIIPTFGIDDAQRAVIRVGRRKCREAQDEWRRTRGLEDFALRCMAGRKLRALERRFGTRVLALAVEELQKRGFALRAESSNPNFIAAWEEMETAVTGRAGKEFAEHYQVSRRARLQSKFSGWLNPVRRWVRAVFK